MLRRAAKRAKLEESKKKPSQEKQIRPRTEDEPVLGEAEPKDRAEQALEQFVLGGEAELLDNLEEFTNKTKVILTFYVEFTVQTSCMLKVLYYLYRNLMW